MPNGLKQIVNFDLFKILSNKDHVYPLLIEDQLIDLREVKDYFSFVLINADTIKDEDDKSTQVFNPIYHYFGISCL